MNISDNFVLIVFRFFNLNWILIAFLLLRILLLQLDSHQAMLYCIRVEMTDKTTDTVIDKYFETCLSSIKSKEISTLKLSKKIYQDWEVAVWRNAEENLINVHLDQNLEQKKLLQAVTILACEQPKSKFLPMPKNLTYQ